MSNINIKHDANERMIMTRIDDIIAIFKDYLGEEDMPPDTKPLKLYIKPGVRKIAILCESASWKPGPTGELIELPVKFSLRRIHPV